MFVYIFEKCHLFVYRYNPGLDPNAPDEDVIIPTLEIKEAFKNAGRDVEGMISKNSAVCLLLFVSMQ